MKKTWKRIMCGVLSLGLASTLVVEQALRSASDELTSAAVSGVGFKDVTGTIDTSSLRESNFNNSVLKAEESTPTYETRSVIVTLSGDALADASGKQSVSAYANTFSGQQTLSAIRKEQNAFLRDLKKAGIPYTLERSYETLLNAVAVEINTQYVSQIKKMQGVESVVITTTYAQPETYQSTATQEVFNLTSVYETGIYDSTDYTKVEADDDQNKTDYGEGTVVAILDTGLDYTHEAFQRTPDNPLWNQSYVSDKLNGLSLQAEIKAGGLELKDVYVSDKVPFAFDYADDDADVYPSYSNHGTHVAGIIGGYTTEDVGYTDKDGNDIEKEFRSVAPDAQLMICKVFTDDLDDPELGGAIPEDIIAALEDCVWMEVDVINMSLGTSCGFTTTDDGDDEGEMLDAVYDKIQQKGISLVCAASNDYSSGYGGVFGTNLKENPDSSTVGSPSTFAAALSVASISGQESPYMIGNAGTAGESFAFFEESRDENGNPYDFVNQMLGEEKNSDGEYVVQEKVFDYVVIPGTGAMGHYTGDIKTMLANNPNLIVLVKRGDSTFEEKVRMASRMGAKAIVVYNNVAGIIRMNLGEIEDNVRIPAVSIDMDAGAALEKAAVSKVGKITISRNTSAGPFMSEFSSWGPTHDLQIKPEITAHGGEITSTVPGGYGEQSGTSMASPNMAGVMALIRNYVKSLTGSDKVDEDTVKALLLTDGAVDTVKLNRLANQLIMSTATTVRDTAGRPYSPRKQGAGLGSLANVIEKTSAFLWVDDESIDNRPKLQVGDNPSRTGVIDRDKLTFKVTNFGTSTLRFTTDYLFFTETISKDGLTVAEQAYALDDIAAEWYVGSSITALDADDEITVGVGETVTLSVKLQLSSDELDYLSEKNFKNGMYLEGFLKLISKDGSQCDLSIPFLGFHGDWESAPMLDYTAYEVAADDANPALEDSEKKQASVWATQPYSIYYNEKYVLPMGGYVYLLDEYDDPVYTDEKFNAISRYNDYYGEDEAENYMTTTGIKAVYAGLLRNTRLVTYTLTNTSTGEQLLSDKINRVNKAYAGGGQATPSNVELKLYPEELGLLANGEYRMDFTFYMNNPEIYTIFEDDPNTEAVENPNNAIGTYSFTFTVDYEAPVLQDARIRYKTVKDASGKESQTIYLDVDVYDNHYAQAIMLCYPKTNAAGELTLQLATDYATPVRNGNKNGTTTVSIDITDIYDQYGSQMYLQIDDYAVNTCLYQLDLDELHQSVLPDNGDFALADGEENITLDIYETHKVALVYDGSADNSNFAWSSDSPEVAAVKNGEIVGLSAGEATITVSNRKGDIKMITVNVTENQKSLSAPGVSFGIIKTNGEALAKAEGTVSVNAGQDLYLQLITDPWYHPMTGLRIQWSSMDESIATVDQKGNVKTLKKGITAIEATVYRGNIPTMNVASVTLNVVNEFDVSNYTLRDYNGVGYNKEDGVLWIPTDMNIMYIGEDAFKDNDNIKAVVIPSSVIQIQEGAFENCSALEAVYFVSTKHRETMVDGNKVVDSSIDWADLSLIYERAFYNCKKLKTIDLSNVKTFTIASETFAGCSALSEIIDMPSIGTMYHRAFKDCTSLTSVDLTGLFVAGDNVFEGCVNLAEIKTDKFTTLGKEIFKNCTGLRNVVTLSTPNIGEGAFSGCTNLTGVKFQSPTGVTLSYDIGARAFENCGTATKNGFTVDFGNEIIRTVGRNAFAGTGIAEITINDYFDLDALRLGGLSFNNVNVTLAEGYVGNKYAAGSKKALVDGVETDVFDGAIYNGDMTKLLFVNTWVEREFVVPASVTEIGDYAFANGKVTMVTFENAGNIQKIGKGAFQDSAVAVIDLMQTSIRSLAAYTFYGADITTLQLPAGVTEIGDYAFAYSAIRTLVMPGVQTLGNGVFEKGESIQKVVTSDTLVDGAIALSTKLTAMGDRVFYDCGALTSAQLPSLEKLGTMTFARNGKLTVASFGDKATATGTYTFMGTALETFAFAEKQIQVGAGMFYGVRTLESVTLSNLVSYSFENDDGDTEYVYATVGDYAFMNCGKLSTVNNLDKVVVFETQSMYNTALETLTLTNAETIGVGAFAVESMGGNANVEATYTAISMPNVQTIGAYAFLNGGETKVDLPASVQEIGYGAFASSAKLVGFAVAAANETFVALDAVDGYGVLYRYIDKADKTYEVVCYPANRTQAATNGKKTYTIAVGTVYVQSAAFLEINKTLDEIVFPYSVKSIGDDAFFNSGINEYTFESMQAPKLEVTYREQVRMWIEAAADEGSASYYKGYYYTNFETYLYEFTSFGGKKSNLILNYPTNGVGYDNYIYGLYFGTKNKTTVAKTDATLDCIKNIQELPTPTEIATWLDWDNTDTDKIAYVTQFSELVKAIREAYKTVSVDTEQAAFLTEYEGTLSAVETALKPVSEHFGIIAKLQSVRIDQSSTHKTAYIVGETFDMTGLQILLTYDDGTTKIAESSTLTLLTSGALKTSNRYVEISYNDGTDSRIISVDITVSRPTTGGNEENPPVTPPEEDKGCGSVLGGAYGVFGLLLIGGAALAIRKKNND